MLNTSEGRSHPFRAADYIDDGKLHILLAASGSVATIKLPLIAQGFGSRGRPASIRIVTTESASQFLQGQATEQPSLAQLTTTVANVDGIYTDADEWAVPWTRRASILHIELRKWADVMVIAPLSANTLAKITSGISDNLLLSVVRAWDTTGAVDGRGIRPIVVAPAMNTAMWLHPVTEKQLAVLEGEWALKNQGWFHVIRPKSKSLACGDTGIGAMEEWDVIVDQVFRLLSSDTTLTSPKG